MGIGFFLNHFWHQLPIHRDLPQRFLFLSFGWVDWAEVTSLIMENKFGATIASMGILGELIYFVFLQSREEIAIFPQVIINLDDASLSTFWTPFD